ncbi:MAG: tetratricopeptide repeat protein [bacterium]
MDDAENKTLNDRQPETPGLEQLTDTARSLKNWLITAGLAAVIVLAIFLYRANRDANEEKASRMLGEARNVQALQAILNQYPSTSAARLSILQMAKAQYDNGDYVAAQTTYKNFLSKYPDHPMAGIAEVGLIHCTEGVGQTDQALAAFTAFALKNKDHFLAPVALFGKARCLETLKRHKEARAVYEDFLVSHPKSEWQGDIEEALKQLDRDARKPSVAL